MADPARAFEQNLLREWKRLRRPPRRVLVAVSGGADSLALAEMLWRWRRLLRLELAVAHVHHGTAGITPTQRRFRDRAARLVRAWCAARDVRLYANEPEPIVLRGEAALRDYRLGFLSRWRREGGFDAVAFAHHRDDLLETRLLRLIRGTGERGLEAMRLRQGTRLRPLLGFSKAEILQYAKARGLAWVEDPANARGAESLRAWVRREWLPALEARSPGATGALARSLALVAAEAARARVSRAEPAHVGLRRERVEVNGSSSRLARETLVADYLRALGLKGYTRHHVREILKRIDSGEKRHSFEMLGLRFEITPDLLRASRV